MVYIIKSIGILIVIWTVLLAALPAIMLRVIEFAKVGKRSYFLGVARIVFGALLLWACPSAHIMWIPAALGALMVLSGIFIFAIGMPRLQAIMTWWSMRGENVRRALAIVGACLGALLIYSA